MEGQTNTSRFGKTVNCPSSSILLSYQLEKLESEIAYLVKFHLHSCEFCSAELKLLAFCPTSTKLDEKAPEIPMDLRILAESILRGSIG